MKKKLEADLISIAHRILQMKNKSDINQLLVETQKLQEKLSVLKFVEDHFGDTKPTIGQKEMEEKLTAVFENNASADSNSNDVIGSLPIEEIKIDESSEIEIITNVLEEEVNFDLTEEIIVDKSSEIEIITNEVEEEVSIDLTEEIQVDSIEETVKPPVFGFTPAFELDVEFDEEPKKKTESVQISFEDLLGPDYNDTLFVKVDTKENESIFTKNEIEPLHDLSLPTDKLKSTSEVKESTITLQETKTLKIDLNDRIAFVKHLFGNSNEDYNRVLNQLITYDNFEEAQYFIEDMVKPDYNNWEGKEDYSQRFMDIIEKKFA
jgi:hypothetical protein